MKEKQSVPQSFNCDQCSKTFGSDRALKNHVKSHETSAQTNSVEKEESKAIFVCTYCQKNFQNETNLNQHVKSKHESGGVASISADHKGIVLQINDNPIEGEHC